MFWPLTALVLWVGFIGVCLHWGRDLAPWLNGPGQGWVLGGLIAGALAGAGLALAGLARLEPHRRRRATLVLTACALGFALTASLQGAFIERTHLLLYGVLGLLCYAVTRRIASGWRALLWAVLLGAAIGIADEVVQHFHPQRVGAAVDAYANIAASSLTAWAGWEMEEDMGGTFFGKKVPPNPPSKKLC